MSTAETPAALDQQTTPAAAAPATAVSESAPAIDPQTVPRSLPDAVVVPVQEPVAEPAAEPAAAAPAAEEEAAPPAPPAPAPPAEPAEPIKKLADEKEAEKSKSEPEPVPEPEPEPASETKAEPEAAPTEEETKDASPAPVEEKPSSAPVEVVEAAKTAETAAEVLDAPKEKLSNLSFILKKPREVEFAERPIPKIKSEHDVLVAVNYTGICGSDVHYWQHGAIGHFVVKDPMVLGHESAGTIVEVGAAVKTLRPGDRVALEPGYPCRRCGDCLAGRYNICHEMVFAATPPYDGTLTGFWVAPFDFCYRLPDHVSTQEGALIEPLAVAVHIVRQARVHPGQSVVVMGAGPVGLLCAAVARSFGATKVVSVDIVRAKLDFARDVVGAATHTYLSRRVPPAENARAIVAECGLGAGADVVIDASGAEPSIQTSLHVVKVGGTYVQGGMGKADVTFPIMALCLKEVTARGSFRYGSGDYRLAIELVAAGKVDVRKLITGVVGFRHAEEAFHKVREGEVIKILIAGPNERVEREIDTTVDEAKARANEPVGTDEGGCC